MKITFRNILGMCVLLLAAAAGVSAQTTTLNFDSPPCTNSRPVYSGIDFTAAPWVCESAGLSGDATKTLSWDKNITTGTFSFTTPAVLKSLRASSSGNTGNVTIKTDAGETVTIAAQRGVMPPAVNTAFTRPATVITVSFPGGWTIELDDLTFTSSGAPPPPSTVTGVTLTCAPASVAIPAASQCTATVAGTGAFNPGVNYSATLGTVSSSGLFTPNATGTAIITAASIQDATKKASANVLVSVPLPPAPICARVTATIDGSNFAPGATVTLLGKPVVVISSTSGSLSLGLLCSDATITNPVVTPPPPPPPPPPTTHTVTVEWAASSSTVSSYRIYRSSVSGSAYMQIGSTNLLTWNDPTVQNGNTYFYVSTAVDAGGNESDFSNEASAVIPS